MYSSRQKVTYFVDCFWTLKLFYKIAFIFKDMFPWVWISKKCLIRKWVDSLTHQGH